MEVRVLGETEVVGDEGLPIHLGPTERRLLARLAVSVGNAVADDVLIDTLWGRPPATAHKTLHGHIHRLRRALGATAIRRTHNGYSLEGVDVDADVAGELVRRARQAVGDGDVKTATDCYERARRLFRGRAVPELDDDHAAMAFRQRVTELESCCSEELFELELQRGRHSMIIGELEGLLSLDPTRERSWCLLVTAYAGAGRHSDALSAVTRARRSLAIELGVEPGPQLRSLEHAVLEHRIPTAAASPSTASSTPESTDPLPVSSLPGPLRRARADSPFVGREAALTTLAATWAATIADGRLSVQILVGEAGIGKTRLAAEFARSVHEGRGLVLFGRSSEVVGSAYQPLQQVIERAARRGGGRPGAEQRSLASALRRLSSSPILEAGGSTPEADRYELFEQIASALEATAASGPVLVVLDDLHWATRPTMLALIHLVRRETSAPLGLVLTVRAPEFGGTDVIGAIGAEPCVSVVQLDGLQLDEVRQFVDAVSVPGVRTVSSEELLARTDGNPFFLEQLVRSGDEPTAVDQVPLLVRDVIAARVRRLPAGTNELLQIAALMGLEFELDVVADAAGRDRSQVIDALDAAIDSQLIVERSSHRLTYEFRHAIIRDALLAGTTRARQSLLHHRIAQGIERVIPQRSPATLIRLAHHHLLGDGGDDCALGCALAEEVGLVSMLSFGYEEAARWFATAIEASLDLADDPERACRLRLELARALTLTGEQSQARLAAEQAWQAARVSGDRERECEAALLYAGEPELNVVGDEPGRFMLGATLDLAASEGRNVPSVMARLGSALSYVEHDRALALGAEALRVARASNDLDQLGYAIRCWLRSCFDPDRVAERVALADELTALGRTRGDEVTESWGWRWQVTTRFELGEIDRIEHACHQLAQLGHRLHLANQSWSALARLAAVRTCQGRFDEAEQLLIEASAHQQLLDNSIHGQVSRTVRRTIDWLRGAELRDEVTTSPWAVWLWLRDDAGDVLAEVARQPDLYLDRDISPYETIVSVALSVRQHPHPAVAEATYPWAARHATACAAFAPGAAMYGSMHLYTGLLANSLGLTGQAVEHLRAAVTANGQIGAAPFLALSLHELADLTNDRAEARRLGRQSRVLARQLGIPWLA